MILPPLVARAYGRLRFMLWGERLGLGRPIRQDALDHEYESGAWDHFFGAAELPRHEALLELIHLIAPRPRLLDLGCGSGRLASLLTPDTVSDYLGVDLSAAGLARARSLTLPHGNFLQADFERWTPEPGRFDVIAFNECLGYAPDPLHTALRFAATLRPGGALAVSHFQSSNHLAFWRRLSRAFEFPAARVVTHPSGQTWDVRLLRSRS
jgi:trans-aconitate methyltransferase